MHNKSAVKSRESPSNIKIRALPIRLVRSKGLIFTVLRTRLFSCRRNSSISRTQWFLLISMGWYSTEGAFERICVCHLCPARGFVWEYLRILDFVDCLHFMGWTWMQDPRLWAPHEGSCRAHRMGLAWTVIANRKVLSKKCETKIPAGLFSKTPGDGETTGWRWHTNGVRIPSAQMAYGRGWSSGGLLDLLTFDILMEYGSSSARSRRAVLSLLSFLSLLA